MEFRHLVSFTHICYLTVSYDVSLQLQFRLFRSKLSFRTLYDFDFNEAIDVYDLSYKCSIVVVKVLNTLIRQSFTS